MKFFRLLYILLALLLLSSCALPKDIPVLAPGTETESEAEAATETETETEPETEAETEPPAPKKRVAITFDDGPSRQGLTQKIVDEFAKYGGRATFFVLGNLISSSTGEAMAYAAERGFEFGIHAYTHELYFDSCTDEEFLEELALTAEAIGRYVSAPVTLLRAPGGRITTERAMLGGYPIIGWSIDTEDWRYRARTDEATIEQNVAAIVQNALSGVRDGDILLMHEIYSNSYEALCLILAELDARGFEFVTVTELFGEQALEVGKVYYSAPEMVS